MINSGFRIATVGIISQEANTLVMVDSLRPTAPVANHKPVIRHPKRVVVEGPTTVSNNAQTLISGQKGQSPPLGDQSDSSVAI